MSYSECVVITTYNRPELLQACTKRIRAIEPEIPLSIFPDRGTAKRFDVAKGNTQINFVPDHDYHGNTFNTMEALRWAYNEGWDRVYLIEDDVMVHPDFFDWHRAIHNDEDHRDLFASMAWVFNRIAPITNDLLFQPWYYSIGTCFTRKKLELIVEHSTPRYYEDMQGYIEKTFPKSNLNSPFGIQHFEQDGLIQRVLDVDHTFTVAPGIAKCSHVGFFGYNRGWTNNSDFFEGQDDFDRRVQFVEDFIADPYARAEVFGRDIVEREIGYVLPKREFHYKLKIPDGWESEFTSELTEKHLPKRINSVRLPADAMIEKVC